MRYEVEYECPKGARGVSAYSDCKDAGMAFAKCQKDHPDCKMIRAVAFSGVPPWEGRMEHEYPSPIQRDHTKEPRPATALKPAEALDCVMPFYDKVVRH